MRFPGIAKPQRLVVQTVYEDVPGVFSYSGRIEDDPLSHFTISVRGGEVMGKIHQGIRLYVLQGNSGVYDITEIDKTLTVQHDESDRDAPSGKAAANVPAPSFAKTSSAGNVRLLYLYAPDVVTRKGSPDLLASNIVAETNSTMQASGVSSDNFVTLAGMQALSSNFPGLTVSNVLVRMRNRSDEFVNLNAQMQFVGADIALTTMSANDTVICPDPDLSDGNQCTTVRIGGVSDGWMPTKPFAVVTDSYALGDLTAPHEIGHVLGGQHQVSSGKPTYIVTPPDIVIDAQTDARGYVDTSGTWMTMMGAYRDAFINENSTCLFRTLNNLPSCARLPRWSNPESTYNYMDLPTGVNGVSNMARALGIHMPIVAAYSVQNAPLPGTTGAIDIYLQGVTANLSWAPAEGVVDFYQLEAAANAPKPDYWLIYSGPSTSASHDLKPPAPYHWRVRACNGNGCGPYTTRSGTI